MLGGVTEAGPWLSDDEQAAWRSLLGATRQLADRLDRQLRQDSGLSHADYEILVRLSESAGARARMRELAEAVSSSPSRLSHAVAGLERAGWVRREPCPLDRRGTVAVLTEEGAAVLAAAAPGHVGTVRRCVFDPLPPGDVATLHRITAAIEAAALADEHRTPR